MSLSCSCDYDDAEWWYEPDGDFSILATKRGRKCCSCGCALPVGSEVVKFRRWRSPVHDLEERIYGDEVDIPPWFMCEKCGGLYMAVSELNMCCAIDDDMATQIKEYAYDNGGQL